MQTYLVHMREPQHYIRQGRFREFFSLQLVVGGKAAVLLINPLMWLLLITSIAFRPFVSNIYGNLIPLPILVISITCLVAGNFFYGYIYLLACMKREQYHLVKWMLLIPLYWLMASIAACMALYQGIVLSLFWNSSFFENPLSVILNPVHTGVAYYNVGQTLSVALTLSLAILGPILAGLAACAIVVFALRSRFRPDAIALLALFVPYVFTLLALYNGYGPLSVAHVSPYLNAVRAGGVLVPVAAVFLATLLGGWRQVKRITI